MRYKAIISDLDGTLLNSNHIISDYTKNVIKKIIKEKGVKFIIATGRHYIDASCFMKQLGAESYLISSNGANAHTSDGKILIEHFMDKKDVDRILEIPIDKDIIVNTYTSEGWDVDRLLPDFNEYHKESGFTPNIVDFKNYDKKDILKFCYIGESQKIEELENNIKENKKLLKDVTITASLDVCLEIMKKDVSKGKTLKEILDKEGIKLSETIAFGDGLNDEEMLSIVGKGLIMGNASEKLKKAQPNLEVIGTNDEDAEAKYLEKIFLEA